ncbi:hypothetical protein L6452_33322 [Arctium lappa]|uniref:Uncharacterized protein n=1 Tax=Arctium lappa TaxID=4217 RepID=A0ACB8YF92_ARCLA|nr:hypothetical protein L6452_33322 [Arctium lappa]
MNPESVLRVEKAKDDDTKEKIRNKIALYKERIQSRRLSQIFDEVVDSLPSDSAVEISKEDLDDFDELIKRNVENVCSQNRADELKSEGSLSDCGNTSSDASIDGLGKGDVRKSTTWVLCPNWNKMSREEKKAFVEAEELKRKEVLREEMARKRELEKVKNIIGSELNDQDLVITESILGILDNIGKNDEELAEIKAKELLEVEIKKVNEKEKYDGTWNVVRRRRGQNRNMGAQGRQNGGIQIGGAVGKKNGVIQGGGNQVEAVKSNSGAVGPSGSKSVVDQSKNAQKIVDKGKNVQGNDPVVSMEYKPVVKLSDAKMNANGGNAKEVEIKNKFDVLNKIPLGVTKETWELQKKTADIWIELGNEPPDHIRKSWSKGLLDYYYARCDLNSKMGNNVLSNYVYGVYSNLVLFLEAWFDSLCVHGLFSTNLLFQQPIVFSGNDLIAMALGQITTSCLVFFQQPMCDFQQFEYVFQQYSMMRNQIICSYCLMIGYQSYGWLFTAICYLGAQLLDLPLMINSWWISSILFGIGIGQIGTLAVGSGLASVWLLLWTNMLLLDWLSLSGSCL